MSELIICETVASLRHYLHNVGSQQRVGLVPTMGYLHEGHMSLVRHARAAVDIVVLSIFVNPLQFGVNEDLDRYPRDREHDLELARQAGVDCVFIPAVSEMYPQPLRMKISVDASVNDKLCGLSRPGHFDGVTTVVMKLLQIVQPNQAFFGLKDAQQVAVIKQMIEDFNVPTKIVACPTIREADGLAKSSRNVNLTQEQREQAPALYAALVKSEALIRSGLSFGEVQQTVIRQLQQLPESRIDYVEILTWPNLQNPGASCTINETGTASLIVALAVKLGQVRLIDNRIIDFDNREG